MFIAHTVYGVSSFSLSGLFYFVKYFFKNFSVISDRLFSNPIFCFCHLFDDAWISYQISFLLSSTFLSTFSVFQFFIEKQAFFTLQTFCFFVLSCECLIILSGIFPSVNYFFSFFCEFSFFSPFSQQTAFIIFL